MNHRSFGLAGLIVLGIAMVACGDDTSSTGSTGAGGEGGNPSTTTTTATTSTTTSSTTTTTASTTTSSTGEGGAGGATTSTGVGGNGGATTTTTGVGGSGGSGGDACATAMVAAVPSTHTMDNTGAATGSFSPSCASNGADGPELAFMVTPSFTGNLRVLLTGTDEDFVLYSETVCGDLDTETACVDVGVSGEDEVLIVPVTTNVPVYVYVDGYYSDSEGAFTVSFEEAVPESSCTDFIDNDFNGFVDCEDATLCQTLAACAPGAGATGVACTVNSDCGANANDPICFDQATHDYPAGYCSEFCDVATDDCTGDAICLDLLDLDSGNGVCFDGCLVDSDCRGPQYSCADLGAATSVCVPDSCFKGTTAVLGANAGDTSTGGFSESAVCIVDSEEAREQVFTYTPAATGTLTLTLSSALDLGLSVRTKCDDATTEVDCLDDHLGGTDEVLTVPVTIGLPIAIIIDGYNGAEGPFTLTLAQ
jgi:hypothetical protein